jgi:hypothetical protein
MIDISKAFSVMLKDLLTNSKLHRDDLLFIVFLLIQSFKKQLELLLHLKVIHDEIDKFTGPNVFYRTKCGKLEKLL